MTNVRDTEFCETRITIIKSKNYLRVESNVGYYKLSWPFWKKKTRPFRFSIFRRKKVASKAKHGVCILDRQLYYPLPPFQEVIFIGGGGEGGCKNKK